MPYFYYFMNGSGDVCCMLSIWRASPISFPVILQQPYEVGNIIILESKTVCSFTVPHNSWVTECRFEPRPLTWENVVLTGPQPRPLSLGTQFCCSSGWRSNGGKPPGGPPILLRAPHTRPSLACCLVSLAGSALSSDASPFPITSFLHAHVSQ